MFFVSNSGAASTEFCAGKPRQVDSFSAGNKRPSGQCSNDAEALGRRTPCAKMESQHLAHARVFNQGSVTGAEWSGTCVLGHTVMVNLDCQLNEV